MFSKALFRQSCKANGVMWAIITVAVCFMLACVMLISGGGGITGIKDGMESTIIQGQIESNFKSRSITYYELNTAAMEQFDSYFTAAYQEEYQKALLSGGDVSAVAATAYSTAAGKLAEYATQVAAAQDYAENSDEAKEIKGVIFYTLKPSLTDETIVSGIKENGDTPEDYDVTTITSSDRAEYRSEHCRKAAAQFFAYNMTTETAVNKLVEQLESYGISKEKYEAFGYTYASIKEMSGATIVDYSAELEYKLDELGTTPAAEELATIKSGLVAELTTGFLDTLPDEVSTALREVGSMDLYNLIVGSIFYKMAGLLLPFIYVIMVSNSLIAGQVDSGSMAYILSSSTKRRQVTFTQGVFLVLSLLCMTLLTTLTSVICLYFVKKEAEIAMTYAQLVLMNVGSFVVLFAVSGICFMSSCIFNRSKSSMAIGGGVTMFFLVATMLGLFGSEVLPSVVRLGALNYFNYVSIISLFDVISITSGTLAFLWKFAILIGAGLACYIIGNIVFRKKDLPL